MQTEAFNIAKSVAAEADTKSDRWLMVFMLFIVIVVALVGARWFARIIETSLKEQMILGGQLKQTMESCQDCVERNTTAWHNVVTVMNRNNDLLTILNKNRAESGET